MLQKESDQYSIGNQVLDYIEAHSQEDPSHPGHKAGFSKALTRGVSDTSGVEARLDKDINDFFASKKRLVNNVHWDKYLTDVDIKEFIEKHLRANNWDMVPKDVRKACYKIELKDGSSHNSSEALSCSGTGTSGSDGENSSDNVSDGNNKKGSNTSFNDILSSDKDSDTSDNDDLKMTVNIDKAMLN